MNLPHSAKSATPHLLTTGIAGDTSIPALNASNPIASHALGTDTDPARTRYKPKKPLDALFGREDFLKKQGFIGETASYLREAAEAPSRSPNGYFSNISQPRIAQAIAELDAARVAARGFTESRRDRPWTALETACALGECEFEPALDAYVSVVKGMELRGNSGKRSGVCRPDSLAVFRDILSSPHGKPAEFVEFQPEAYLLASAATGERFYIQDKCTGFWRCPLAEHLAEEAFGFAYSICTEEYADGVDQEDGK